MKRIVTAVTLGLLLVACGGHGPSALGPGPSGLPSPTPSSSPSTSPTPTASPTPGKPFTFQIWLTRGGKLFETMRTEPFVPGVGQLALDDLVAGPTGKEINALVDTAIPSGLTADITSLRSDGEATVRLIVPPLGGVVAPLAPRIAFAQFVYTLTQYRTISSVVFGTEPGVRYTRASFADLLPQIVVESPVVGETVSSPVTVSGMATVFEGVVSLRILDENGNEIAKTFTMASCFTGCPGDYSTSVRYAVGHEQPGIVEVYEASAKDGSPINVQDIPVILTP